MILLDDLSDLFPAEIYIFIIIVLVLVISGGLIYYFTGDFNFELIILFTCVLLLFFDYTNVLSSYYGAIGVLGLAIFIPLMMKKERI